MVTKYSHIVPQFYLKHFAIAGTNKSIYAFNKSTKICKKKNIKKVACEKYYYDYPDKFLPKEQTKQECEMRLSKLEDVAKKMFDKLVLYAEDEKPIPVENIGSVAVYMAVQILRGQKNREHLRYISRKVETPDIRHRQILEEEFGKSYHDDFATYANIQSLIDTSHSIDVIYPELSNRFQWYIGVNESKFPLFTSDEPIVNNATKDTAYIGEWKITDPGKAIYFPISPKYIIMLEDRYCYAPFYINEWPYKKLSKIDVEYFNILQVAQSCKYVFCNENRLESAISLLDEYPQLGQM